MSKLLKSKILLGVLIVAVLFVGAVVVNKASASDCSLTTTLKQGMRSSEVTCLQTKLGMTTVTGYFGSLTKASVIAFQTNHSLVADGIVGAKTRAALVGTSTEALCPNGMTLASNCSKAPSTTPTATEALCPNGMTLASNCTTAPTGTPSTVTGGAGDLEEVNILSTYSSEEVLEGDEDVKVMAFELKADTGSDLKIHNVKLGFANTEKTAGASKKMDSVIDEVKVWMGSTEVGSASADSFSESDDIYTKAITLTDAVVKAGEKAKFYITVSSVSNVDSDDLGNDWTVAIESVRFSDAEGVVVTDSSTGDLGTEDYSNNTAEAAEQLFSFEDLSSSGDIELKVSKDSSSPDAQAVEVDDTNDTNDVLLLSAKLKAEGTDMTVDNIEFNVYPTGANANEIVKEYKLLLDGEEIDSIDAGSIASGATGTIEFTDLEDDFTIDQDDTVVLKVVADINDLEGNFGNGDSVKVSFVSADNVKDETNTVVEDENGDTVEDADRSGSAIGETQTFFADGMQVKLVSVDQDITTPADKAVPGSAATGTFVIKFDVTAFGDDIYLDKDPVEDTDGTYDTTTQLSYSMLNTANVAASTASLQSTADLQTNSFLVEEGTTETFTLTVAGTATADTFTNVKLEGIGYKVGLDAAGDVIYTSDLDSFKTGDLYLEFI